jgi:hypothetical protein
MTSEPASSRSATPAHVRNGFQFHIPAPLNQAAPLFGPDGERCWAGPQWDPAFLHPQPGSDIEGAIFTVQHGYGIAVWVNTLFDPAKGRMHYVAFVPGKLVTTVDVRLTAIAPSKTKVEVSYARTSLSFTSNDLVVSLGEKDRESGPEWERAIETCLEARRAEAD